jgi:hypothetical protein
MYGGVMKKSRIILLTIVVVLFVANIAHAGKVKKGKQGMYWQLLDSDGGSNVMYQVDTVTQQCFTVFKSGTGGGITKIPCERLAKRPDWKPIITWAD